jgi:RiboL-PSP-HEPN
MMLEYSALAADLDRIRRFLESGSDEQTPDQRRFSYIGCISALYSSFENFVEREAFRFGEMLLTDSSNLSSEQMSIIRRRYVRNASALLGQTLGVGRYRNVSEFDVAKSLASFLDDSSSSFDLRLELMALHTSNLRWDSMCELFQWGAPDIPNMIRRSDAVDSWMSRTDNVTGRTLLEALKNELEDLVERRNEVAHRAIPDDILSNERLLAKVDFIEAISLGLVASLAVPLLEASIKGGETASLGVPAEYYRKNRVVIFAALESSVSEGDCILLPGKVAARWGRVLEVQLDDKRVPKANVGTEAGLRLDFEVRKKTNLLLWKSPDPDLAFPPNNLFGNHGPLGDIKTPPHAE